MMSSKEVKYVSFCLAMMGNIGMLQGEVLVCQIAESGCQQVLVCQIQGVHTIENLVAECGDLFILLSL